MAKLQLAQMDTRDDNESRLSQMGWVMYFWSKYIKPMGYGLRPGWGPHQNTVEYFNNISNTI